MESMPPPPTNPSRPRIGIDPSVGTESESDPESDPATPLAVTPVAARNFPQNPQEQASQRLLDQLKSAVAEGHPSASNYCCGGNYQISTNPSGSPDPSKRPVVSPPIILRFDSATGNGSKLQFPPEPGDEKGKGPLRAGIEDLLESCTTETAAEDEGGAKEARGQSARLERDRFAVDFHPSDFGILDAIKQVLLPGAKFEGSVEAGKGKGPESGDRSENWVERQEQLGVRAELCQLNVYSNTSSRGLRPLATPPRRGTHFATLVVCLPFPHQGGDQVVTHPSPTTHKRFLTHKPHSTHFYSLSQRPVISWTAFLRTSTHSILPITSGHLVTLTYNLHVTEAVGGPFQRFPATDPRLFPFYKVAKAMLENPDFLPEGGPLGIHCTHPYYHTRKQTQALMPHSLRGIDAIIFCVFRALGMKVLIGPILGDEAWDEWEQVREQRWVEKIYSSGDEPMEEEEEEGNGNGDKTRVGKAWHKLRMVSGEGGVGLRVGRDPTSFINHHYPLHVLNPVTWLNEPTLYWEIAMVNLKHTPPSPSAPEGSGTDTDTDAETDLMWQYSHAAIFIEIPPADERRARGTSSGSVEGGLRLNLIILGVGKGMETAGGRWYWLPRPLSPLLRDFVE